MGRRRNSLGQPIGPPVAHWKSARHPPAAVTEGRTCRLERLVPAHHVGLWEAFAEDTEHRGWTYLSYGPFASASELRRWIEMDCLGDDPYFFSVLDRRSGRPVGMAAYLRFEPAVGVVEVGHLHFSPLMKRRPIATEAMYLMMRQAFEELGYRRYEWKCDALNAPSRVAAERLGFCLEGIFRQATIYKGRSRDTAWYSILDREWPAVKAALEAWLDPANFDEEDRQRTRLSRSMKEARDQLERSAGS